MSTKDAYEILMERLEYPGSSRLRAIMENVMTPEEAQMVVELPGSPEGVAQKTGFSVDKVRASLDELYFRGVIFPRGDFDKRDHYRFARSMGQFHDATMATKQRDVVKDREFYQKWYDFVINEWYPARGKVQAQAERPRARIVPAYQSIKDLPDVLPCENFPELLKTQRLIAVVPCSCRYCTTSVGKHCAHTSEEERWNCIQFDRGAEYAIARGTGKKLSPDEALELADKIEEDGLIHIWRNDASMTGMNLSCQCCRDCCMTYAPMDIVGESIGKVWAKSRYQTYVNTEDCNGCQTCIDRCQFDAIDMVRPEGSKKFKAVVDPEKCYGCGVCAVTCEPSAMKMMVARPPEHIPGIVA